jgi:hypothetical protein
MAGPRLHQRRDWKTQNKKMQAQYKQNIFAVASSCAVASPASLRGSSAAERSARAPVGAEPGHNFNALRPREMISPPDRTSNRLAATPSQPFAQPISWKLLPVRPVHVTIANYDADCRNEPKWRRTPNLGAEVKASLKRTKAVLGKLVCTLAERRIKQGKSRKSLSNSPNYNIILRNTWQQPNRRFAPLNAGSGQKGNSITHCQYGTYK